MPSCKSCDLYSRGVLLEYQLGDTLFEYTETSGKLITKIIRFQETAEVLIILKVYFKVTERVTEII